MSFQFKSVLECAPLAQVAKLVDAPDLGSGVEIRGGSSPFLGTSILPETMRFNSAEEFRREGCAPHWVAHD